MSRARIRLTLASAAGLVASGLVAAPAQAAVPPTISVYITAGHTVRMVEHMRPGVHRFKVGSAKEAAFQIVRAHGDYSKAKLVHDVNTGLATEDSSSPAALKAIKRFERHITLLGGVSSRPKQRGVMWANLTRGSYWMVDTDARIVAKEDLLTVHVGGGRVAGVMPSGPTIRAIHETDWAKRPASIPHKGVLRFENDSEDNHFIAMAKLLPGKTIADFRRWVNQVKAGENAGPPPFDESVRGLDTGVVSPGRHMTVRYDIPRGRYVLMCFWPDADMGGMPHVFMGMYRAIRVG